MTSNALPLGSILEGRYRIDYLIAEGGFGAVYRATHIETGGDVAIKVLQPELAHHAAITARFVREGQLLTQLHHPGIVRIHELGVTFDGTLFLAMELLRGESLGARLARGPVDWQSTIRIARELCAALAEAHARGIVHRELKPANIHLEPGAHGETVKVLDFGVAKLIGGGLHDSPREQLTFHGEVVGTFEYMAPEQLLGSSVDQRADLYALGAVLYEMLTGQRPYASLEGTNMLLAHLAHRPPALPSTLVPYASGELADDLDRLVMRCLAGDPQHRYQSVHELADALAGIERRATFPRVRARGTNQTAPAGPIARGSSPLLPVPALGAVAPMVAPRPVRPCDAPTVRARLPHTLPGVSMPRGR